ncbi:hypothetical protein U1Q18_037280, partial [Sarracenia purpurea var. burkii]
MMILDESEPRSSKFFSDLSCFPYLFGQGPQFYPVRPTGPYTIQANMASVSSVPTYPVQYAPVSQALCAQGSATPSSGPQYSGSSQPSQGSNTN